MTDSRLSAGPARPLLDDERFRFLLVGGWNTVFGYGIFVVLERTLGQATHYLLALLVAHVIATLVAFLGHRYITFRVKGSFFKDLVRFWSVYAGLLAVNAIMLPLLVEVGGVPVLLAQALFIVVTTLTSYAGHKYFSFRR
jgi:putative flippase GtrA